MRIQISALPFPSSAPSDQHPPSLNSHLKQGPESIQRDAQGDASRRGSWAGLHPLTWQLLSPHHLQEEVYPSRWGAGPWQHLKTLCNNLQGNYFLLYGKVNILPKTAGMRKHFFNKITIMVWLSPEGF